MRQDTRLSRMMGSHLAQFWATLLATAILGLETTGALLGAAQYSQSVGLCDSTKLIRCQQDVIRDLQTVSLQSASIQHPINIGPPYSPKQLMLQQQQQQYVVGPTTCRLMRSNLDCLMASTPNCYDQGLQAAQNTDILYRAKRFIEQNNCNEPDTNWQTSLCYRSPEIRSCEERYGFTSSLGLPAGNLLASGSQNLTACLAYQAFKYCAETHSRLNCKVHEMDMLNEYLLDKASDLAFRCPTNRTGSYLGQLSAGPSSLLVPSNAAPSQYIGGLAGYEPQRVIPTYSGSNSPYYASSPIRDQPWERFRQPVDSYGLSRYPGSGSSEVFDRLIAETDGSDCHLKAAPYARECEDTLLEQHRLARDSRDGNELQRRLCCSLFQYRDCISRVVLDRCADSTPTAVEILMGPRRREMTVTCRGFNRDVCSGSPARTLLSNPTILAFLIVSSFLAFKHTLSFGF